MTAPALVQKLWNYCHITSNKQLNFLEHIHLDIRALSLLVRREGNCSGLV